MNSMFLPYSVLSLWRRVLNCVSNPKNKPCLFYPCTIPDRCFSFLWLYIYKPWSVCKTKLPHNKQSFTTWRCVFEVRGHWNSVWKLGFNPLDFMLKNRRTIFSKFTLVVGKNLSKKWWPIIWFMWNNKIFAEILPKVIDEQNLKNKQST